VHVRRLIAVEAGEEHPVRTRDALDPWYSGNTRSSPPRSA
jgi:hypothetical protein